uniref:LOB domain-containing protein 23 n=2 Tax=Cajanus cajan TaxID=3821 RepID=A0A151U284_CAJCA|nr:LOB domain-containing protein 23 [Cajanus cajan]
MSGRCAACKNQRRRCPSDCIFAPYFPANDPQRFASVHRIYGGSNVGKMLQQIPPYLREQAANTLYYEAQCRIRNPVYGCVGVISKLSQEISNTEIALSQIETQIDCHKNQVQQAKAESKFNVLSTIEAESNFDVLQGQSSSATEFHMPSQLKWFNKNSDFQ